MYIGIMLNLNYSILSTYIIVNNDSSLIIFKWKTFKNVFKIIENKNVLIGIVVNCYKLISCLK